jgi:hypothetical protein
LVGRHGGDALVPEEGGDDVAAHIEAVVVGTAAVDQHPFSAGKFDEDRIIKKR